MVILLCGRSPSGHQRVKFLCEQLRLFKSHRSFKGINSVLPGCCVKKKMFRDFSQNEIRLGGYHVRIRSIRYMVVSSAYICSSPSQSLTMSGKSLQQRENKKGRSTDP